MTFLKAPLPASTWYLPTRTHSAHPSTRFFFKQTCTIAYRIFHILNYIMIQMAVFPKRKSMRYAGYDYTQPGGYFVTFFTRGWLHMFGEIVDGKMILNRNGKILEKTWLELMDHYAGIELDEYIVMPNHFHGIIIINGFVLTRSKMVKAGLEPAFTKHANSNSDFSSHGLSEIVRSLKTFSARKINMARQTPGKIVWHRGYYDRIIRNQGELDRIRTYIRMNPARFKQKNDF